MAAGRVLHSIRQILPMRTQATCVVLSLSHSLTATDLGSSAHRKFSRSSASTERHRTTGGQVSSRAGVISGY